MRVGIVTTWFERGAAYVSRQFKQTLEQAGHKVFIFARGEEYAKGDPNWDSGHIHWAKTWLLTDASKMQVSDFKRWLVKNKIQTVIFNEQRILWPIAVCQHFGVKTVAYIDYYRNNTVQKFNCFDGIICNTKRHYSVFSWHPGVIYIPWGTVTDLFIPTPEHPRLVLEDVVTFFHSAGYSDRKGTDVLIEAFSIINKESRLIIHTQKPILDMFPHLKNTIDDLKSQNRLTVINKTIPAPGLYHLADVYVYPTKLEGIGLTICEAMSCGLASIVPDNGPMNEFGKAMETSLFVEIDSFISRHDGYYWPMCLITKESLAEKLQYCIDNKDWVISAKKKSREEMVRNRDWLTNSTVLSDYLKSLKIQGQKQHIPSFYSRMVKRFKYLSDI